MAASPLATVGVLSIGEMGVGIAALLLAHNYRVIANISGRSEETQQRARDAKIETLSTDVELVDTADYVISIVPPKDAMCTARRIIKALKESESPRDTPLYYLDLNAISPRTAREIAAMFDDPKSALVLDGGIIGGAPCLQTPEVSATAGSGPQELGPGTWTRPRIPTSGPHPLSTAPKSGAHLSTTLNNKHIAPIIGPASGLKMCFSTTSKGFIALALQAFTTAQRLGVLPELRDHMADVVPTALRSAQRGVPKMPPKAYRWVREMEEIAATHAEDGGFGGGDGDEDGGEAVSLFRGVAAVYRAVALDPVLGVEKTGARKRGRTLEDVATLMGEGLAAKRKKMAEQKEEDEKEEDEKEDDEKEKGKKEEEPKQQVEGQETSDSFEVDVNSREKPEV